MSAIKLFNIPYDGRELDIELLGDNGGSEVNEPLASAPVLYDGVSEYAYEIGFVPAGEYTLALSCDVIDDPDADDNINMLQSTEATVTANNTPIVVNFNVE